MAKKVTKSRSRTARKKSSRKKTAKKKSAKKAVKKATRKATKRKKSSRKKTAKRKAAKRKPAKRKATKRKAAKRKPAKRKATKRKAAKRKSSKSRTKSKDRAARQRVSSRHRVYQLTREVPEYQYFVLANGKPVKHVAELASLLDQLEDHVFHHHVTADRNDFHNWIKDVFDDIELARKISGTKDKKHLQLVIYKHLAGHDHK